VGDFLSTVRVQADHEHVVSSGQETNQTGLAMLLYRGVS
jgi:hypothetical protein